MRSPVRGVYSGRQLARSKVPRSQVDKLVTTGRLTRVARGWYATDDADNGVVAALRSGTRLTCVSAARLYGLWAPPEPGVHIYAPRGHNPHGYTSHGPWLDGWPETSPIASLDLTLRHSSRCLATESAAVLFESALTQNLLSSADVDLLRASLPGTIDRQLSTLTALSQSGSETRIARWLRSRRVTFLQQVRIRDIGRVDFLVGKSWIIEADSRAHHTGAANYEADRRRDLSARVLGYRVTRLSFAQVWGDWEATTSVLTSLIATRQHLNPPRSVRIAA